nr:Cytosine deaminase [Rachicladosporium sp. CCFEE 5018]
MSQSDVGFKAALDEAKKGADEGGVPIGACLVSADGKILGRGHNMRVQKKSPTIHAEISALENAGRLPASAYKDATMYTTLSPCDMCTGACILYKVRRVVLGENNTFVGGEAYLKERGIEVVNVRSEECEKLMTEFIKTNPGDWYEDIGEPSK